MRTVAPVTSDAAWEDPYPEPPPPRFRWLKWLWWIPGLLVAALVVLVVLDRLNWPDDPDYQGRPLSEWMADLASPDPVKSAPARQAILGLGTNAVPSLIVHLGARDSILGRLAMRSEPHIPRQVWVFAMQRTRARDAVERRTQAALALAVLGSAARPALPALERAIADPEPRVVGSTAEALRAIVPEGWSVLVRTLDSTNEHTFAIASSTLARVGTAASSNAPAVVQALLRAPSGRRAQYADLLQKLGPAAVQALAPHLVDTDAARREVATAALRSLVGSEFNAVRAVVGLLEHPDPAIRADAAGVLGATSVWARTSITALAGALKDPEARVRVAAAQALGATTTWTTGATNALPALRDLAASGAGPESEAAAAALRQIEEAAARGKE